MIGMSSPFLLHYFFSDVNIQNGVLKMKIFITHIWNSLKSLFVHGGGLVVRRCDGIVLVAEASIEL
jgi:hypothetical protein